MTILVLSDTHGREDRVDRVLDMHRGVDMVLFLGDGLKDMRGKEHNHRGGDFAAVSGNCDCFSISFSEKYPTEHLVRVGEYTILMMHGHTRGVKHGTSAAEEYAASIGADILLYGHTHIAEERYMPEGDMAGSIVLEKPLRVFNPGSLGYDSSFGLIQIRGKDILMSHGTV